MVWSPSSCHQHHIWLWPFLIISSKPKYSRQKRARDVDGSPYRITIPLWICTIFQRTDGSHASTRLIGLAWLTKAGFSWHFFHVLKVVNTREKTLGLKHLEKDHTMGICNTCHELYCWAYIKIMLIVQDEYYESHLVHLRKPRGWSTGRKTMTWKRITHATNSIVEGLI